MPEQYVKYPPPSNYYKQLKQLQINQNTTNTTSKTIYDGDKVVVAYRTYKEIENELYTCRSEIIRLKNIIEDNKQRPAINVDDHLKIINEYIVVIEDLKYQNKKLVEYVNYFEQTGIKK